MMTLQWNTCRMFFSSLWLVPPSILSCTRSTRAGILGYSLLSLAASTCLVSPCSNVLSCITCLLFVWERKVQFIHSYMICRFYHDVPAAFHKLQASVGGTYAVETDDIQIPQHYHRRPFRFCHQNADASSALCFPRWWVIYSHVADLVVGASRICYGGMGSSNEDILFDPCFFEPHALDALIAISNTFFHLLFSNLWADCAVSILCFSLVFMYFLIFFSSWCTDVIFLIYLYQRWIYPVDKKRVNEFGFGGEDEDKEKENLLTNEATAAQDGAITSDAATSSESKKTKWSRRWNFYGTSLRCKSLQTQSSNVWNFISPHESIDSF